MSFLVATAGVNASNFLFHVVVSRLLGPAHYGAVGSLLSLLTLLAVPVGAAQLAVTQAVIAHESKGESYSLRALLRRSIVAGVVGALVLVALTPIIDRFLHLNSPLPLMLVALWVPLATSGAVLQGALIGEYRFRAVAFAAFMGGGPVRLLAGAAAVLAGFGVSGAIAATVAAQVFTTACLLISSRHKVGIPGEVAIVRTSRRDLVMSIAATGSYTALVGVDTFLARHFFAARVAGQYAAGAIAAHIALFVPGALVSVAFPHFVSGDGVNRISRRAFAQALKFTLALGIVAAGVLAVFARPIVALLFGGGYARAVGVVGVLAVESAMLGVISLFVYVHLARRSVMALVPWLGMLLAIVAISLRHESVGVVALIMLVVIAVTLVVTGAPALVALARAAAAEAAREMEIFELPPEELDLTVVVPFYNPGSRLGKHVAEILEVLTEAEVTYEVLAVSDGSTDHSEEYLSSLASDRLSLVCLEENQGKGAALRAGLSRGRGKYLGFIDGDGDLPASLLTTLLEIIDRDQPDIVYGSKRHPESKVALLVGLPVVNRTSFPRAD
ncbi:MAG: glycosyltransferase [Acidimicrobiales bacterium]